ncbi:hypothetical protein L596_018410 [Steinernema carpocapsae]|uniref:Uncharacterized protein n=1 Tax=Steinernema carpocapsae TaxID=34508 RepID=A0A4U5N4J4_STECR|nr:hypothetical protein L596_018410 [Steinernema carpocapsae]
MLLKLTVLVFLAAYVAGEVPDRPAPGNSKVPVVHDPMDKAVPVVQNSMFFRRCRHYKDPRCRRDVKYVEAKKTRCEPGNPWCLRSEEMVSDSVIY